MSIKLPSPFDKVADCVWLPRILQKARMLARGELPQDYVTRFCHPSGVDGQFLEFFKLGREDIVEAATLPESETAVWFTSRPSADSSRVAEWNQLAVNLGKPGYPVEDRLQVARNIYPHLNRPDVTTIFELIVEDEGLPRPVIG